MRKWTLAYASDKTRTPTAGSAQALREAIGRGADLRIYTTFDWMEHMGAILPGSGLIQETIDHRVTYLLDNRWVAALTALRYPANCGLGFGAEPSLSFFMYNQDAQFGIARPYFQNAPGNSRQLAKFDFGPMYHVIDHCDDATDSPSHNAFYDFGEYRWLVCDDWQELLAHDADGAMTSGSLESLCDAFRSGHSIKVGVKNLCRELAPPGSQPVEHEVFVELGSMYNHTAQGFLSGESLPLVRIAPGIPLRYASGNWNFGWILPRTDGTVFHLVIDPYTREIQQRSARYAIRWFAL